MTDVGSTTTPEARPEGSGDPLDDPVVTGLRQAIDPPSRLSRVRDWPGRALAAMGGWGLESWVSLGIVAFCVGFVFVQLGPSNVLSSSTPAGGDMGAHVWAPAYLRDHLLPSFRLTGWTPDWYAGFPAFQFYMVLPSLAIALLSYLIPYGTAFKLVAISGVLTLPIAAWAFGKLTRLPFPTPPLLAVAATAFLFDRSFSIYGGNIASTLAGEFAFSISLTFAILYLGVVGRGLDTGRRRGIAAVLLALTGLCHLIPFLFALGASVVWLAVNLLRRPAPWWLVRTGAPVTGRAAGGVQPDVAPGGVESVAQASEPPSTIRALWRWVASFVRPGAWRRTWWMLTAGVVGVALTMWWLLPFYLRSGYMNDMGWEKKTTYVDLLFQRQHLDSGLTDSLPIQWLLVFALVGVVLSIAWKHKAGIFLLVTGIATAVAFRYMPQGRLWNARLLPFWYLILYLLAAIGIAELGRTVATLVAPDPARPRRLVTVGTAVVAFVVGLTMVAMPLRAMPDTLGVGPVKVSLGGVRADGSYHWLFLSTRDNSFVPSWARWNFTGYEGKAAYPEYYDVVQTMANVGRTDGCGRAMWEFEPQLDRYGTPMALMLLPFWTNGCIGSMEGLYFEASATTPYHFINQDELSTNPSNAQRGLPYQPGPPDQAQFDLGIRHLQMLGVRYYMATSERMIGFARQNPSLTEIASSGPWVIFEVKDSQLVVPLDNQPAVLTGVSPAKGWLDAVMPWYTDPSRWDVYPAAGGPSSWQRVAPGETPQAVSTDPVAVTNISTTTDTISFDVSKIGTPVLVRSSYFPNWQASGAKGPWRVGPNMMVVVPTSDHVELHYGRTAVDWAGLGLSLLGLVGLIWLWRAGPVTLPETVPWPLRPGPESGEGDGEGEGGGDGPGGPGGRGDGGGGPPTGPGSPPEPQAEEGRHRIPAASFDPIAVIVGGEPGEPGEAEGAGSGAPRP